MMKCPLLMLTLSLSYMYFTQSIHDYPVKRGTLQSDLVDDDTGLILLFLLLKQTLTALQFQLRPNSRLYSCSPAPTRLGFNPNFPFINHF